MIKTQILLWKTIESGKTLGTRLTSTKIKKPPWLTDPTCKPRVGWWQTNNFLKSSPSSNESKQKGVSWMFSFVNVVIIVLCFFLYSSSFFIRTYFILILCFIPSAIWLCKMVDVCNPQNYIKVKFIFCVPLRLNFVALNKK